MVQPAEAADRYLNDIITNELFMSAEKIVTKEQNTTGKHMIELGDLAARNIQRGRDHGLRLINMILVITVSIVSILVITTATEYGPG